MKEARRVEPNWKSANNYMSKIGSTKKDNTIEEFWDAFSYDDQMLMS